MIGRALLGAVLAIAIVVGALIVMYLLARVRSRATGARGFVQHSRLTCPKCRQIFDYTWVPGAALTAVRLGRARYMACPLCRRWSMFDVWDAPAPPA